MARKEKKPLSIQPTLLPQEQGELMYLTLDQFSPENYIDADWPDDDFIVDVQKRGIQTPLNTCPENRVGSGLYFPYDGRRRYLALYLLNQWGMTIHLRNDQGDIVEVPVNEYKIPVYFRDDLTPETARSDSFKNNYHRRSNPITDVEAVRSAAIYLNVDPFTKVGRKQIAEYLGVPTQVVTRISKGLMVSNVVYDAYKEGRISSGTLQSIIALKDDTAKAAIAQQLFAGDTITQQKVAEWNQSAKRENLQLAFHGFDISRDEDEFDNPLVEVRDMLQTALDTSDFQVVESAIRKLEEIIQG